MDKKMTIFYKIRNLAIDCIMQGIQDLRTYGDMDLEDAELIYGYLVMDDNNYLRRHVQEFELIKDTEGNLSLQMREEYKEQARKFL